jgi:hypothetical protein
LEIAVLKSWDATFHGDTAEVLLMTISTCLDKQRDAYAHLLNIFNSSGTGKSRMVDQVAKKVVTIPMCLSDKGKMMFYTNSSCILMFCSMKGFPPPDRFLINWLSALNGLTDRNMVMKNLHAFLYALFAVTNKHLAILLAELSLNTTHTLELPKLTKEDVRKLPDSKQNELVSLTKAHQEILAVAFHD